ncbi:hypothetical protein IGI04_019974 [Brassica rapa subsp. trilocularis]|uniref:Uncharacterized protein n=1 Tax=Brassica rapa subsp. trilocularis TaxID=1813537 RepID=A0ABQ7MHE9_BRACM|nr:hypothetical protein IGI04_019974 [Brassica rapa subsp. trilocularis]
MAQIIRLMESWPSDLAAGQGREQAQPAGDSVKPAHSVHGSSLELIGPWGLDLGQGTLGNVMGLIFGQPGREEQFGSYSRKGAKGAVLCLFSLTAWPRVPGTENGTKFLRQSSAKLLTERKKERDRRLEKRTVCGSVGLPACSECGKARP